MVYYSDGSFPVETMPYRVRRSNGLTYTSEAVYSEIDDPAHPYRVVSDPPEFDMATQYLSWDGTDWLVMDIGPSSTAAAEAVAVDAADTIDGGKNG